MKKMIAVVTGWVKAYARGRRYKRVVPCAKRGFTLVELLTVITLIGVLAALLLPALSWAKFQAKNTSCQSNLRQMQLALELYATSYDAYPPIWSPSGGTDSWYRWDMLLVHLAAPTRFVVPFSLTNGTVAPPPRSFLCPLLTGKPKNLLTPGAPAWDSAYRYNSSGVAPAFNGLGLGGIEVAFPLFSATKQSAVIAPSDMVCLGDPLTRSPDATLDGSYNAGPTEFRPEPAGAQHPEPDARTLTTYRNHRSRYNRGCGDGHVEIEDCSKRFVDSDAYLARWNIDHEAHRELWKP